MEENIDPAKTTCSCTKHKMCREYHSTPSQTKVRFTVYGNQSSPINGISTFLASTYNHHSTNPTVSFFHNLGQAVPSLIRNLTTASRHLQRRCSKDCHLTSGHKNGLSGAQKPPSPVQIVRFVTYNASSFFRFLRSTAKKKR